MPWKRSAAFCSHSEFYGPALLRRPPIMGKMGSRYNLPSHTSCSLIGLLVTLHHKLPRTRFADIYILLNAHNLFTQGHPQSRPSSFMAVFATCKRRLWNSTTSNTSSSPRPYTSVAFSCRPLPTCRTCYRSCCRSISTFTYSTRVYPPLNLRQILAGTLLLGGL